MGFSTTAVGTGPKMQSRPRVTGAGCMTRDARYIPDGYLGPMTNPSRSCSIDMAAWGSFPLRMKNQTVPTSM